MSVGPAKETPRAFSGRDQMLALLAAVMPGTELKLEVRRQGVKDLVTVTLKAAEAPEAIPDKLPEPASAKKALAPRKRAPGEQPQPRPPMPPKKDDEKKDTPKPETGLVKHANAAQDHTYWVYVPDDYDPNVAYGLVVWLHDAGKGKDRDMEGVADYWQDYCREHHLILLAPLAQNESGWLVSESDAIRDAVRAVMGQYTIDRQRVVAHGMGSGGQLAYYLGFHARDLFRGVAVSGAALAGEPADSVPTQRLSFFIVAGGKDPLAKVIAEAKPKLAAKKYAVVYR